MSDRDNPAYDEKEPAWVIVNGSGIRPRGNAVGVELTYSKEELASYQGWRTNPDLLPYMRLN